jgi:hypothetical protein
VLVLYWVLAFALWGTSMSELRAAAKAMGLPS